MLGLIDRDFWQYFISSGLATLIGAFCGFALALWGERRLERQRQHERRDQLLGVLRETLIRNRHILEHIRADIEAKRPILISVNPTILDSTATLKYETITDVELNRQIDLLRYEFHYLDRELQLLLTLTFSPAPSAGSTHQPLESLIDAIETHAARLIPEVDRAVARIHAALGGEQATLPPEPRLLEEVEA